MKTKFIFFVTTAFYLLLLGCSAEEHGIVPPPVDTPDGEKTVAQLRLENTYEQMETRAADTDTEGPTDAERKIVKPLNILVFKDNGSFEREYLDMDTIPVNPWPGTTQTDTFTITSGRKFFYIFSGVHTDLQSFIPNETNNKNRLNYEKTELTNLFGTAAGQPDIPILASPNFLNATLWWDTITVAAGGTKDNPREIEREIGRVAAKVKLQDVNKGSASLMKGDFLNPHFRLGAVPTKCYLVGQYEGTIKPPKAGHGQVISAVHNEGWEDPANAGQQNPLFRNYAVASYKDVSSADNFFYAVENTTAPDVAAGTNDLYYGNTTHVRLRTKYVPEASEITSTINFPAQSAGLSLSGDFWTIYVNGVRYLVDANPDPAVTQGSKVPAPDAGTEVNYYVTGLNYHKFVIRDRRETLPEKQCCVLRNHYYEIEVTDISDLGDPDDTVKPWIPVEQETDLIIRIKVIDWSKITQKEKV